VNFGLTLPWEIIREIEAHNSKLDKAALIHKQAENGNDDFFKGLRYALDGFDTFGVKKIPERAGPDGPGLNMDVFEGLADMLIDRDLTGDAARDFIDNIMKIATNDQWNNWYRRILMKDLKAGFSESTVNKACQDFEKYQIPVFSCQLAQDAKDKPEKLTGLKMVDVKLDGARVLTIVKPSGHVVQVSRNGKLIENFPKIRHQFEQMAKNLLYPVVIDGEMMSASFQALMTQFKRKTDVDTDDSIYHVFDIIPLAEFHKGRSTQKQLQRRIQLSDLIRHYGEQLPNVSTVGYEMIDLGSATGERRFEKLNEEAIEGGYEGLMIKDPDGYYETKRSWAWMKLKPRIVVTLPIVRVERGDPDSKYANVMGALWCEGVDSGDEEQRYIEVSCGGGFSDDERAYLWKMRAVLPGVLVDIEADAITKNQNGRYSLRFPRKKTFRGLMPGEKI
jgi:DNA ligase-1